MKYQMHQSDDRYTGKGLLQKKIIQHMPFQSEVCKTELLLPLIDKSCTYQIFLVNYNWCICIQY